MTAADTTASAYLRTRVLTATPEQLRLMLLEGGARFLRQGRDGLAAKDYAQSFDGFSKARNIIIELMNSMRPDVAPELCAKVHGLYVYIYQLVVEAGLERDIAKADKAVELLEYECETWKLAMQKLAEERGRTSPTAPASSAASISGDARPAYRPLSIQG